MAKEKETKPMANTVIGSSIVIDGEVSGDEPITVLGQVKGKIAISQNVTIETGAHVEADVEGQTVTISGRVTGNVVARERLELKPDAKMVGDAKAPRIVVADGASFKGNVDMDV
jgi:cytoskeletal protein CcmA (bactofilin family)